MGSWWYYTDTHVKAGTVAGILWALAVITTSYNPLLLLLAGGLVFVILFALFALIDSVENFGIFQEMELEERANRVNTRFDFQDLRTDRDLAAEKRQAERFKNIDRFGTVDPPRVKAKKRKKKGKVVHSDGLPF